MVWNWDSLGLFRYCLPNPNLKEKWTFSRVFALKKVHMKMSQTTFLFFTEDTCPKADFFSESKYLSPKSNEIILNTALKSPLFVKILYIWLLKSIKNQRANIKISFMCFLFTWNVCDKIASLKTLKKIIGKKLLFH